MRIWIQQHESDSSEETAEQRRARESALQLLERRLREARERYEAAVEEIRKRYVSIFRVRIQRIREERSALLVTIRARFDRLRAEH